MNDWDYLKEPASLPTYGRPTAELPANRSPLSCLSCRVCGRTGSRWGKCGNGVEWMCESCDFAHRELQKTANDNHRDSLAGAHGCSSVSAARTATALIWLLLGGLVLAAAVWAGLELVKS